MTRTVSKGLWDITALVREAWVLVHLGQRLLQHFLRLSVGYLSSFLSYLESRNMSSKGDSELDKSGQRYIFCFLTNFNVLSRKMYISRGLK